MAVAAKPRVLVLGGGFGGLESAFYLRTKLGEASISLLSDLDHFFFKPNSIYVPFGLDPQKLRLPLERPMRRREIELIRGTAVGVDPDARTVETDAGELDYDFLVIATGSGMRAEEIPGLAEHAISTWSAEDMLELRAAFMRLLEDARAGRRRRALFLVPPGNACSGPLYEIVLMFDTWLRRKGGGGAAELVWTTCEPSYIHAFGPRLHQVVAEEFDRRGIEGHTGYVATEVTETEVRYESGESVDYDLLVSFPPYVAGTRFPGLPGDDRGFIATELESRRVLGHPEVYAVGDAGDFPVKQAFLAFLQADAAAERIAAEVTGSEPESGFDPVSMCVMDQFDKATFAKVPLRLTGDPADPLEVRPGAESGYQVGSSLAWRAGKKMLGISVPWRFRNGLPFHGGAFWDAMDVGLKGMAGVLSKSGAG